jgi:hypothetical protein
MPKQIVILLVLLARLAWGQYKLDDFLDKAIQNAPALKEYRNQQAINRIQQKINSAENSAFHLALTGDYLFVPYFNNHGQLVTTDPSEQAIGYDINLGDGGLYAAQLTVEKNVFNRRIVRVLNDQTTIQDTLTAYLIDLEEHTLIKEVTEHYLDTRRSLLLLQLARETVDNLQEQLELTATLAAKGFAKPQDYLLLKVESQNQLIQLNDARQGYRSQVYQLYALCGMQDTSVVEIDSIALAMNAAPAHSSFLRKFALDSLATANEQDLFETRYQPRANLFFNTGLNAVELHNIQRKFGMSAGVSLSVPLYDGRQKSLTRQQNHLLRNSIAEYCRFSEMNVTLQRNILADRIRSLQNSLKIMDGQIEDYRQLLLLSEKQVQQGAESMIDHLTLLRNFIDLRKIRIDTEISCQIEMNNYNYWNW